MELAQRKSAPEGKMKQVRDKEPIKERQTESALRNSAQREKSLKEHEERNESFECTMRGKNSCRKKLANKHQDISDICR